MTEHHDLESELQVSLHVNDRLRARIAALEAALDAFHKDPENPDAAVLRYKAIASKAIREQVEIRKEYESRISELEAVFDTKWDAEQRAIKAWQEKTGKHMTWPDHAKMVEWLMDELDAARAALEKKND